MSAGVVARWRCRFFGKVRTLDGLEDICETGRLVFWRRVLPSLERIELLPWLFWFGYVDRGSCGTQARRFADFRSCSSATLGSPSCVCKPVGNLHRLQFGLLLELDFLLFGRVGVVLVNVKPFAENLDCVSRESNAVAFRASRGIISPSRCNSTTCSAVQGFDAGEIATLPTGQFVHRV